MEYVIIVAFILVSGMHGEGKFVRKPQPLMTLQECRAAIPDVESQFRDMIEKNHGAVEAMESRCEMDGEPV